MKHEWLERTLLAAPHFTLCTTEKMFHEALEDLKIKPEKAPQWIGDNADARTHRYDNEKGNRCCIVCIPHDLKRTGIQIAALLVHEAVHVWQDARDYYNERFPSSELEAYSIQAISQELMQEYARQTGVGT